MEDYALFVGVDWGNETHQVCVVDGEGQVVQEKKVPHGGAELAAMAEQLAALSDGRPERVAVGIEVPRGAVVELLVERGFGVFAINPKQLDRFRDRFTIAGAKDDRRDALVLASTVRTDRERFRRVLLDEPLIIELREATRTEDDIKDELGRLTNRLREQLVRHRPELLRLSPAACDAWLWELLERAPTPVKGKHLRRNAVERVLRDHRISRVGPDEVLAALRAYPLTLAPGTVEACTRAVQMLLPRLRLVAEQRKQCAKHIDALLAQLAEPAEGQKCEHRDATILRSLPGVGRVVSASMLAEANQPLAARDYQALRAQAGTAPVTRQSGKSCRVSMRYACNPRLREAVHHWAHNSTLIDQGCAALYQRQRDRGHTRGRALRSLADKLLRILVAMLKQGSLYEPSRLAPPPASAA